MDRFASLLHKLDTSLYIPAVQHENCFTVIIRWSQKPQELLHKCPNGGPKFLYSHHIMAFCLANTDPHLATYTHIKHA